MNFNICINKASLNCLNKFLYENEAQITLPTTNYPGSYAEKLFLKAIRFEAFDENNSLIGLIAGYFNVENGFIWIPYVCVHRKKQNNGVAGKLMDQLIEFSENSNSFKYIGLEVLVDNTKALKLYIKKGFIQTNIVNGKIQMKRIINIR